MWYIRKAGDPARSVLDRTSGKEEGMPGYARREIVREGEIGVYHTWSRCVQKAFLCGYDPETGIDFNYRRDWIKSLLQYQAGVFAVDVGNFSVLSNHQHLIARTRPDVAAQWSDEEVAWRWKLAWPTWVNGQWICSPTDEEIKELLAHPERIPKLRGNLASLSWFMARWKEPIARLANAEMNRKGHYYEQRFGSREIVDDPANLCCNIYLDLNQIKAGMAASLEASHCSAIQDRLRTWRREQILASVEAFQAEDSQGFTLAVGDAEQLLADCYLAPIGDQGPPLLAHASGQLILSSLPSDTSTTESSAPSPDTTTNADFSVDTSDRTVAVEAADSTPTAPAATVGTGSKAKGRSRQPDTRPAPTRKIHERLYARQRKRASDHVYLGIPAKQYLEIAYWTAEQWLEQRTGKTQSRSPPERVAQILRQWGIAPTYWCEAVEKFASWFRRAVGHKDRLIAPIERGKKRWIQGIRACRQVFTCRPEPILHG